jgi:hypothetical protein
VAGLLRENCLKLTVFDAVKMTSTKSVKAILICHMSMGALGALSSAVIGVNTIHAELSLHPNHDNAAFVLGYTTAWPIIFSLWIWVNRYALKKLNKLRDETLELRSQS